MAKYIEVRLIEAEPEYAEELRLGKLSYPGGEGYKVRDSNGDESWRPKEKLERECLKVTPNPSLKSGCSISQEMVDGFIKEIHTTMAGEKTTCVRAVLVNGFEIVEASSCVDPANYDEALGKEICLRKIKDRIWFLLGFLLQTAAAGVKG